MSKKVLVLAGSPRKGGNSDLLCDADLFAAHTGGFYERKQHSSRAGLHPPGL